MRNLLYEESFKRGIDWIKVNDSRWEDFQVCETGKNDLIMACNSLHLTRIGFENALEKIFESGPTNVFLVTEFGSPDIKVKSQYGDYKMLFSKSYETESSFAYHGLEEVLDHWSFKMGRMISPDEERNIMARLRFSDGHMWMRDTAYVGMYWWTKNGSVLH